MYLVVVGSAALKDKVRHRDKGRFCLQVCTWQKDSRPPLQGPGAGPARPCHQACHCRTPTFPSRPQLGSAAALKGRMMSYSRRRMRALPSPPARTGTAHAGKTRSGPLGTATQAHQSRVGWPWTEVAAASQAGPRHAWISVTTLPRGPSQLYLFGSLEVFHLPSTASPPPPSRVDCAGAPRPRPLRPRVRDPDHYQ